MTYKRIFLMLGIVLSLGIISGCIMNNENPNESETETDTKNDTTTEYSNNVSGLEPTKHSDINNAKGITMGIKEGSISNRGLTVVFENNSDKEFIYGNYFLLEEEIDGDWYEAPVVVEVKYGFKDIGYELKPSKTGELEVDWQWLYGELSNGKYRIIKDVLDFRKTADFDKYYMAAEFEIK